MLRDMENRLFPATALRRLLAPEGWTVISSAFPPAVRPVRNEHHRRWARRHPHRHPHREILFILEGGGFQSFGGAIYPARAGSAFVFNSMELHDLGYPPAHPRAMHLWLGFVQDRCVATVYRFGGKRGRALEQWRHLFSLQELGLASGDALFPRASEPALPPDLVRMQVTAGMALLVSTLLAHGYAAPSADRSRDFRDDVIATIQRHIQEANGKNCRIGSLARIAGYSTFHFHRIFREHAGMTLGGYVNRCRKEAFARLATAGLQQQAIAEALGFAHPSALTRWRKRQLG
jgi:AraC-like DNA-binding protein